jgi:pimeloyl-ACP methyl ester carboxylesterase
MYAGPGKEQVAWNQAQTSEMLFTQPVIHEFSRIAVPTLLMIGEKDRTAPGANRAAPEVAGRLGNYPVLGQSAARTIPNATLVAFPELGHSPQVESPGQFHKALLRGLGAADSPR